MTTQTTAVRMPKQNIAEIAVLQVKVDNIEKDISEIKFDIRDIHEKQDSKHTETQKMLKEMQDSAERAHKGLADKISVLERWRWMLMGAGIVIGGLGWETLAKLLK